MIRPPAFWQHDGLAARLLAPLGALTAASTARRVARPGWRAPVPVFCCGNATLGGAGKTTLALDLATRLRAAGRAVHILSRGYGGRSRGVTRVDPDRHSAAQTGDEPLLLARIAPCWIGADRAASARAAIAAGAEVLVMDDGLQNPDLAARHSALVIDAAIGLANGRLFPAGPLREPAAAAAARCDIAVLIGDGQVPPLPPALPVLRARLVPHGTAALAGRRVHAFAGIARPQKFFDTLTQAGAILATCTPFPDHHSYSAADLARLTRATGPGCLLVTTAKDAVRLPSAIRADIAIVTVTLAWDDPDAIELWLSRP